MPFLSDIRIEWFLSPRIIRVAAPTVQVSIQDLHDTLRELEQDPNNMIYPFILSTTGKQVLGPGVFVGLTSSLQNARIAFDARKVSVATGTITTTDSTGVNLLDSTATFITDGLEPGAWIVNITDQSIASAVNIVSETQILTDTLGDGYDNQFTSGDVYKIWPVIQMEVAGGNIVAVGSDGYSELDAILPTAGTQVVRTSSSSATLSELQDIQFSSFNGGVTVDVINGVSGTTFPTGTGRQPVNNFANALTIANIRGFATFFVIGDATISNVNLIEKIIIGQGPTLSVITVDASASVSGVEIKSATLQGTLDGYAVVSGCHIKDTLFTDGFIHDSSLEGVLTLDGSNQFHAIDCWDGLAGLNAPAIDFNNSNVESSLIRYTGGILIRNKTNSEDMTVDLTSGRIVLESSITSGSFLFRGIGSLTNNSTGSAIVNSVDLLRGETFARLERGTEVVRFLVEATREDHQATGEWYYLDPVDGYDTNDGLLPTTAKKTFGSVESLIVSGRRDIIWVINAATKEVIIDDTWNITCDNLQIRAPGHNIIIRPSTDPGNATIRVNAHGVGIEGFTIDGYAGNERNGIEVGAFERFRIEDTLIKNCDGYGIIFFGGTGNLVYDDHNLKNVNITSTGKSALVMVDVRNSFINNCKFDNTNGWGIELISNFSFSDPVTGFTLGSNHSNELENLSLHHNDLGGIFIGGVPERTSQTTIRENCFINKFGDRPRVQDNGRGTHDLRVDETATERYDGKIIVNFGGGFFVGPGTDFPVGTLKFPVDNFEDAITLAGDRDVDEIFVIGNATLSTSDFLGLSVRGQSVSKSAFTVDPSANVSNVTFFDCTLSGTLDTNTGASKCIIGTVDEVAGQFDQCELDGYISLSGDTFLTNCVQNRDDNNVEVTVGDGYTLVARNYFGEIKLVNKTGTEPVIFDMASGTLELDSTVTAGTITVRGVGKLIDNSTGATVVDEEGLNNPENIALTTRTAVLPPLIGLL